MILCIDIWKNLIVVGCKDNSICIFRKLQETILKEAVLTGHGDSVSTVSISPKTGNYLASGSADSSIKIWNLVGVSSEVETTNVSSSLATVAAHNKDINSVKFSPNEKLIASASQDKTVKIWDAKNLVTLSVLKGHKRGVWDISFSPTEKLLVSASGDCTVRIWSLVDYSCVTVLQGHLSSVSKVAWLYHGQIVVSASGDGVLKLWNVKKGSCVNTYEAHEGKVWALEHFTAQNGNHYLVSGAVDSSLLIWEDVTADEEKEAIVKKQEILVNHQVLANFMRTNQLSEAVLFAFEKKYIKGFIESMNSLISNEEKSTECLYNLDSNETPEKTCSKVQIELVKSLSEKDFRFLMTLIRDLNSTVSKSKIAQWLLHGLLTSMTQATFLERCKIFGEDLENILQAIEVHSSRHFERFEKFARESFAIENLLMKSLIN